MRWPDDWYVEVEVPPPDAYWAAMTAHLEHIRWTRGVVAGPTWLRRLVGDTRPPLFNKEVK